MISYYLAARYSRNGEMRQYRAVLEGHGHKVTSRWIDRPVTGGPRKSLDVPALKAYPEQGREYAEQDIKDILDADVLLLFTDGLATGKGGRHVEFGIAISTAKAVVIIGPRENVFQTLDGIDQFDTFPHFMEQVLAGEQ